MTDKIGCYSGRLKELASEHLYCNLDDNEPGYIPPDLKEGTYRWTLYIYSNLYKIGDDVFDSKDRQMFISIASKFKEYHLISWTRDTLVELDRNKKGHIYNYLNERENCTRSFFELKVCIYVLRILSKKWFVVDPFILKMSPRLKEYELYG